MKYHEKLPRGVHHKKLRCQALSQEGERCQKRAVYEITFSGDPVWPDAKPGWVAVVVCDEHMPEYEMANFLKRIGKESRP